MQLMTDKATTLLLPGLGNSGSEHWQSHWERNIPNCKRVSQDNWDTPHCCDWVARLDQFLAQLAQPVVLAAHSSACALVAYWSLIATPEHLNLIRGAMLVAPSDPDGPNYPLGPRGFGPVPLHHLPFATVVVASADDPYISPDRARHYASAWGSRFVLLEHAGHINAASGFGPWLEGLALLDSLHAAVVEA
jgi:predicted alpha/beta hydrolase family esterase